MAKQAGNIGKIGLKLKVKKRTSIGASCRSRPNHKHWQKRWKAYRGQG